MQKLRSVQKSQALLQLRMNNEAQLVCFWCCAPPGFVVQINNFSSLVLFSAVIHKRRRKKLISKTIKYKLGSSSKMHFAFFYPKNIEISLWKIIDFVENLEMTNSRGRGSHALCLIMTRCLRKLICNSPLTTYLKKILSYCKIHYAKKRKCFFMTLM